MPSGRHASLYLSLHIPSPDGLLTGQMTLSLPFVDARPGQDSNLCPYPETVTVFTVLLSVRLSPGGWGLCLPWSRIFGFRALCLGKLALESVGRLK